MVPRAGFDRSRDAAHLTGALPSCALAEQGASRWTPSPYVAVHVPEHCTMLVESKPDLVLEVLKRLEGAHDALTVPFALEFVVGIPRRRATDPLIHESPPVP